MATKKISELEAITEADDNDVLVIVDVSAGVTYKITKANLLNGIDLTDYVKNTDYASDAKAGVVKTNSSYFGAQVSDTTGVLFGNPVTYQEYGSKPTQFFISKGTLDNVLAAQIGDIESILEELDVGRRC